MSTQRNQRVRRNTAVVMALLNLLLVFLVFGGVHRLETVLYQRCVEREALDAATQTYRDVIAEEEQRRADLTAHIESDPAVRQALVRSYERVAAAGRATTAARVSTPCTRLRLLGLGRRG